VRGRGEWFFFFSFFFPFVFISCLVDVVRIIGFGDYVRRLGVWME
jgi:hypothetical protein